MTQKFYPHMFHFRHIESESERSFIMTLGSLIKGYCTLYRVDGGYANANLLVEKGYATFTERNEDEPGWCRIFTVTPEGRERYRSEVLKELAIRRSRIQYEAAETEALQDAVSSGGLF